MNNTVYIKRLTLHNLVPLHRLERPVSLAPTLPSRDLSLILRRQECLQVLAHFVKELLIPRLMQEREVRVTSRSINIGIGADGLVQRLEDLLLHLICMLQRGLARLRVHVGHKRLVEVVEVCQALARTGVLPFLLADDVGVDRPCRGLERVRLCVAYLQVGVVAVGAFTTKGVVDGCDRGVTFETCRSGYAELLPCLRDWSACPHVGGPWRYLPWSCSHRCRILGSSRSH